MLNSASRDLLSFSPDEAYILIVDDVAQNIQVVGSILRKEGFQVAFTMQPEEALDRIRNNPPDLILMDVRMPGMDGFTLCKMIQSNDAWSNIPIIFLTAATEPSETLKGFEAGGVDYITKPFNAPELLARVRSHLDLKFTRDALKQQVRSTEEALNEKKEILRIAAHHLRNPVWALEGIGGMLEKGSLQETDELVKLGINIRSTSKEMLSILNNLLDLDALEEGANSPNPTNFDLIQIIDQLVELYRHQSKSKSQELIWNPKRKTALHLMSDENWIRRILENLMTNAIKFTPVKGRVEINLEENESLIRVLVSDSGPGIQPSEMHRLFQKYQKLNARPTQGEPTTGLGLALSVRMARILGAELRYLPHTKDFISNTASQPTGAHFALEIPLIT